MRTLKNLAAAMSLTLLSSWACADVVTLTFEGATGSVDKFYAGGTDSDGKAGPDLGINFALNGVATVDASGGNAYGPPTTNGPSPHTVLWQRGPSLVINKPAGFQNGFSLFFVAATAHGTVNVYSGIDGTGTLLATIDLTGQKQCENDPFNYYCNWKTAGARFTGVGKSVTISVADWLSMYYDNVTFGSDVPQTGTSSSVSALIR